VDTFKFRGKLASNVFDAQIFRAPFALLTATGCVERDDPADVSTGLTLERSNRFPPDPASLAAPMNEGIVDSIAHVSSPVEQRGILKPTIQRGAIPMSTLMSKARLNHMEVTVAKGTLAPMLPALESFYCGTLGLKPSRLDAFPAPHVFLISDDAATYFIYVAEHEKPMIVGGDDHLGFHMEDRAAVDRVLEACRGLAKVDRRMEIRDLDDLDLEQTLTHAFYFRYLLPIWFDIQFIESKPPSARA
jgi:hypothetical protein